MKIPKELHGKILSEAKNPLGKTKEVAKINAGSVKIVEIRKKTKEILKNTKENSREILRKKVGFQAEIVKNTQEILKNKGEIHKENEETEGLGTGTYDENQSHNYFLEALNEFRASSKKAENHTEKNEKNEKNGENAKNEKNGEFAKNEKNEEIAKNEKNAKNAEIAKNEKNEKNIEKNGEIAKNEKNGEIAENEKNLKKTEKKPAFFYNIESEWHNTYTDQSSGASKPLNPKKSSKICWECLKSFEDSASGSFQYEAKVIFFSRKYPIFFSFFARKSAGKNSRRPTKFLVTSAENPL